MADYECKLCNGKFGSKESLIQHNEAKHSKKEYMGGPNENKLINKNIKRHILYAILTLLIISTAYVIYSNSKKPGDYDNFAKCLTEKGAIVYGNDYCPYTNKQLNYFGKSKKYLNYIKCLDNKELCDAKGVQVTPTWEINNKTYAQIQTFKTLSELTGCN